MKFSKKQVIIGIIIVVLVFVTTFLIISFLGYRNDIETSTQGGPNITFEVKTGDNINSVAKALKDNKIISSERSFKIYASLNGKTSIVAGKYDLSSGQTIPEILEILNNGQVAKTINITFLPGGTVKMAKKVLTDSGFTEEEIDSALAKDYSAEFPQLFSGKPQDTDLEGFIFGETYSFDKGVKVENILRRAFTEMQKYVVDLKLEEQFKVQGLTLYEGITLSSIVQREVVGSTDQRAVAGVFYNRLRAGMNLGSDVTYQYIADKNGETRDYNLDSPYNLRRYTGLTPTPIATPGVSAMKSTANPEDNDYLFFLSGDDDKTYFGKTDAEHEANIKNHCQEKCKII